MQHFPHLAKLVKNRNMVTVAILDVEILGMRSLSVYNRAVHIVTHINASTEKVQLTNTTVSESGSSPELSACVAISQITNILHYK